MGLEELGLASCHCKLRHMAGAGGVHSSWKWGFLRQQESKNEPREVARICRITSAFYVCLRLNVFMGVILGNKKIETKTMASFLLLMYSFLP